MRMVFVRMPIGADFIARFQTEYFFFRMNDSTNLCHESAASHRENIPEKWKYEKRCRMHKQWPHF